MAPSLQISVVHKEDAYVSTELPQGVDLDADGGGGYIRFDCIGLTDVKISLDGSSVDLGKAIWSGQISFAEISAMAQADARSGLCKESWNSKNGLAKFCYSYPDFDLCITNDIYETPDAQQHWIRQLTLSQPGKQVHSAYPDLDQEDWGIAFTVVKANSSSITLAYTQSGGQLIGQLITSNYEISRLEPMEAVPLLEGAAMQERFPISHNSQGSLTLDLESYFGCLPPGDYGMYLYLRDEYTEADVPLLTRNFHDIQCYWIAFSVV